LDADTVERVIFALVAQRALEPGSTLAATRWVAERVASEGCPEFDADAAYAAMDFLLDALGEIAAGVFDTTATLLNLSCDVISVDTTSTDWELEGADELAALAAGADDDELTVRGQPGLPHRRPRALHPRREASSHQPCEFTAILRWVCHGSEKCS